MLAIYWTRNYNRCLFCWKKKIKKAIFTACNVTCVNGEYLVDFDGKKEGTSAILTNLLGNSALLIQAEDSTDIKAGDLVDILLLDNIK